MKSLTITLSTVLLLLSGRANSETLTVMTSYPESVVSRFEEAFESRHPDIRLQFLWRMPFDALPYLLQSKQGGVDVYWTPSQRNFLVLKAAGALGSIGIDRSGLPELIGGGRVSDPEHTFLASETAGYGIYYNPERLATLNLPVPKRWETLADPRFKGEVALPVPSGVGYAHMLMDQLLQAKGWQAGWNIWRKIALNSHLVMSRGDFVTDEVASGRSAVGLTMDFFAASSQARGAGGAFLYPQKTAFNPAQIAITASTSHRPAAETFVTFILSEEGQSMLFHPDIRKLPIRPAVYARAPAGYTNPFMLKSDLSYDPIKGLARRGLNAALFDAAITRRQQSLIEAWRLLHLAETNASPAEQRTLEEARRALTELPIDEPEQDSPLAAACQKRADMSEGEPACNVAEAEWNRFFETAYRKASEIALKVLQARQGGGV